MSSLRNLRKKTSLTNHTHPDSYYNVNNKDPEIFAKQISLIGDPLVVENFLSPSEIQKLIQIESSKPDSFRQGRPTAAETEVTGHCWEQEERELLQPKLQKLLGPFEVWGGNYFSTSLPYAPHVDTGEGILQANYKNVVIPMSMFPGNKETHLILFKQRYFGNNTGFYASGESYPKEFTANGELFEYSRVLGYDPSHTIEESLLSSHLAHLNPKNLQGFSIDRILPWRIGSCIIFDSAQIHCSSDFRRQGISRKSALSLFTVRP